MQYTKNQESPTAFHEWVAVSIISSSIGRNIVIPRVKYSIYPNLYVILVAASARCRKSVALSLGLKVLQKIKNPPMVFAQKLTPEALIQGLESARVGEDTSGMIFSPELSVFMSNDCIRSGIIPILTDLYDSPSVWTYHTRGRGKETLKNLTLSMLAATTKSDVKDLLPKQAVGGGFTSRVVFVYQENPSNLILFMDNDSEEEEMDENPSEVRLRSMLINDLSHIRNKIKGKVKFTKSAKACALKWYISSQEENCEEKLDGYYGRKHDIMFKIATILSVAESDDLIIRKEHIQMSLDMLKINERSLNAIISSVVASDVGKSAEFVYNIIDRHGPIEHSKLLQKCWRNGTAQEVTMHVRTLIDCGEVTEVVTGKNKRLYNIKGKKVVKMEE